MQKPLGYGGIEECADCGWKSLYPFCPQIHSMGIEETGGEAVAVFEGISKVLFNQIDLVDVEISGFKVTFGFVPTFFI